jgi:hypothetical protein
VRLERLGQIHRVYINGSLAIARAIAGYGDFASARMSFKVNAQIKGQLFSVRTGPLKGPAAAPAPKREPTDVYREDFEDAPIGGLPAGWTGSPTVSVLTGGGVGTRLEVNSKGGHDVQFDTPRLDAGFFLECDLEYSGGNNKIAFNLNPAGPGKIFAFGLHPSTSGTTLTAHLPGQQAQVVPDVLSGRKFRIRLEREGALYRFYVNGKNVFAQKLAGYGTFQGAQIQFTVDPRTFSRIYAVNVGPLKS